MSDATTVHQSYEYLSIGELSRMLRAGEISSVTLVEDCLARIERLNPTLNAFITVLAAQAVQHAAEADAELASGKWRGYLHGIPVAVKDMFDTAGIRTTAAFEHFSQRVPQQDADVVRKLRDAGAILIGKTNMHQLAMGTTSVVSYFGSVHNPWRPEYIAGGSSGGSAAAVAAGLCFATIDTDAIGSCRLPASCCGVSGFKPTNGVISAKGILEGEQSDPSIVRLATPSVMCRSAEDVALVMSIVSDTGTAGASPTQKETDNLRIGVVKNFAGTDTIRAPFEAAVDLFRSLGYETQAADVPFDKAKFDVSQIDNDRRTIPDTFFGDADVLILPTTAEVTPSIAEAEKREAAKVANGVAFSAGNTFFCNYFGLPAISVPAGVDGNGLPLGLQIVGRAGRDFVVLEAAGHFQRSTAWHLQHPTV